MTILHKWLQKLPFLTTLRTLFELTLAALIGYTLTNNWLQWQIFSPTQPISTPSTAAIPTPTTHLPTAVDVTPILNAHLFGRETTTAPLASPVIATPPPETNLNLRLQGIYFSPTNTHSRAAIQLPDGKSNLYKNNDQLIDGIRIHEIQAKQVILARQGRYETLRFPDDKDNKNPAQTVNNASYLSNQTNLPQLNEIPNSTTPAINAIPPPIQSPERALATFQQQLVSNPDSLIGLIKIRPYKDTNGNFLGYRLSAGRQPELFAQFNLQEGDILTNINGIALDSPLKGFTVVQQLASADRLEAQVLRNGVPTSLIFNVQK